jgi:hypothetical protein
MKLASARASSRLLNPWLVPPAPICAFSRARDQARLHMRSLSQNQMFPPSTSTIGEDRTVNPEPGPLMYCGDSLLVGVEPWTWAHQIFTGLTLSVVKTGTLNLCAKTPRSPQGDGSCYSLCSCHAMYCNVFDGTQCCKWDANSSAATARLNNIFTEQQVSSDYEHSATRSWDAYDVLREMVTFERVQNPF